LLALLLLLTYLLMMVSVPLFVFLLLYGDLSPPQKKCRRISSLVSPALQM
jgi:hypothetical protein